MTSVPTGKLAVIVAAVVALSLALGALGAVLADVPADQVTRTPAGSAAGERPASPPPQPGGKAGQDSRRDGGSAPQGAALATASPLYRTGRLTDVNCRPGRLPAGDMASYRRFLIRVTSCLNRAWAAQFRKAAMPFTKPRLRIITRPVQTPCGAWNRGADGVYCSTDRTIYLMIGKEQLRNPFPLGITRLVAHEYGHHVQQMSGIWQYYWAARTIAGMTRRLQLSRNSELQAECLSAVFMSTMKDTPLVTGDDWAYTVDWFRKNGAKGWPQNDHGRGPTQAAWMTRGFAKGTPGACNTWAADPRNVT
ncbi:neutral zinc metallopeptidase [Nonomuraea maritima]|uniref:neutral zinc metallopeptidase n=1 Tax=Nonomuraea maritima TaxID=683260 RepID=UPI00371020B5